MDETIQALAIFLRSTDSLWLGSDREWPAVQTSGWRSRSSRTGANCRPTSRSSTTSSSTANQPYAEELRLIGDDTGRRRRHRVQMPGGTRPFNQVASSGGASLNPVRTTPRPLSNPLRNRGAVPHPHEPRAVVTLAPVAPFPVTRQSGQVALSIA
jgi:hypothetical protein